MNNLQSTPDRLVRDENFYSKKVKILQTEISDLKAEFSEKDKDLSKVEVFGKLLDKKDNLNSKNSSKNGRNLSDREQED